MMQTGELKMQVGWSQMYGSFEYRCVYGCHSTDYESRWEAEQAFLSHVCTSVGDPI